MIVTKNDTFKFNLMDVRCITTTFTNRLIFVDELENIIFFQIPKNMSSLIRHIFNINAIDDEKCLYNNYENYKKYAIIREPISRIVSVYIETMTTCRTDNKTRFIYENEDENETRLINEVNFFKELIGKDIDENEKFKTYLEKIHGDFKFFEIHCIPQIYFIIDENFKIKKDIVLLSFDEIKKDKKLLGKDIEYINGCKDISLQEKLINYIQNNEDIKKLIHEIYEHDFLIYEMVKGSS